jgi:hypothetical protein
MPGVYGTHHVAMQVQPSYETIGWSRKAYRIDVKVTYNAAQSISEMGHVDSDLGVCSVPKS